MIDTQPVLQPHTSCVAVVCGGEGRSLHKLQLLLQGGVWALWALGDGTLGILAPWGPGAPLARWSRVGDLRYDLVAMLLLDFGTLSCIVGLALGALEGM